MIDLAEVSRRGVTQWACATRSGVTGGDSVVVESGATVRQDSAHGSAVENLRVLKINYFGLKYINFCWSLINF